MFEVEKLNITKTHRKITVHDRVPDLYRTNINRKKYKLQVTRRLIYILPAFKY